MHSGTTWRLGHRPALDGLRGVAIGLVLIGHVGTPGMEAAGMAGVTLFFVLSGFLITSLLGEEHDRNGRISLRGFYARRARRLAPALLVSTTMFVAIGLAGDLGWFFRWPMLWPVLGYVGNWTIASGHELGALGGTWSLAVEEQFYIVWPLVAIFAMRHGWRRLGQVAVTVMAASLAVRLVLPDVHTAYYRTDVCAVSLATGALLAVIAHRGMLTSRYALAGAVLLAGACIIPTPAAWDATPLAATLGAALVLPAALGAGPLAARWLRWLGSRSYGIYLWHIPPLWTLNLTTDLPWWAVALIGIPPSLLVAEASYRWVEQPFRKRQETVTVKIPAASHVIVNVPAVVDTSAPKST